MDVSKTIITKLDGNVLEDSIEIRWQTAQEVDSDGFFVFRLDQTGSNTFIPLTGLIISQGVNGGNYLFVDNEVEPNVVYSYLLIERKIDGTLIEYPDFTLVLGFNLDITPRQYIPLIFRS